MSSIYRERFCFGNSLFRLTKSKEVLKGDRDTSRGIDLFPSTAKFSPKKGCKHSLGRLHVPGNARGFARDDGKDEEKEKEETGPESNSRQGR